MSDQYHFKTVEGFAEGVYTNKGSKFIGFVFPIQTEDEFKLHLKQIKSKNVGARHFCFAWRLHQQNTIEKSNDDGEPSGTAGKPILNQLKSKEITNSGLVVVRYFGGTLLGTAGLIQAYKGAATEAINNANIIKQPITKMITITLAYADYSIVMDSLRKMGLKPVMEDSDSSAIKLSINLPVHLHDTLYKEMEHLKQVGCSSIHLL